MNKPMIMTVVPHFSVLRLLLPFKLIPANVAGVFTLRTSTSLVPARVRAGRALIALSGLSPRQHKVLRCSTAPTAPPALPYNAHMGT
jgi:hypothetical protein